MIFTPIGSMPPIPNVEISAKIAMSPSPMVVPSMIFRGDKHWPEPQQQPTVATSALTGATADYATLTAMPPPPPPPPLHDSGFYSHREMQVSSVPISVAHPTNAVSDPNGNNSGVKMATQTTGASVEASRSNSAPADMLFLAASNIEEFKFN